MSTQKCEDYKFESNAILTRYSRINSEKQTILNNIFIYLKFSE